MITPSSHDIYGRVSSEKAESRLVHIKAIVRRVMLDKGLILLVNEETHEIALQDTLLLSFNIYSVSIGDVMECLAEEYNGRYNVIRIYKCTPFDTITDYERHGLVKLNARVKWYNYHKGYGFMNSTDLDQDIFLPEVVLKDNSFLGALQSQELEAVIFRNGDKLQVLRIKEIRDMNL